MNTAIETVVVEFGTPEFTQLAIRLAAEGRQGCLAMPQSLTLWESGKIVGVRMPQLLVIPEWAENPWPNQTATYVRGR